MKTRLLKELRREAKSNVFIIPIGGDMNRCVVEVRELSPDPICSGSWVIKKKYYFRAGRSDDWRNEIPDSIRLKSKSSIHQPYTLDQAVKRLNELRREYIIRQAQEMRLTWGRRKENLITWFLKLIF